jgi:hypothetical protein
MLRRIESWARQCALQVKLTGVDINPHAVRTAQKISSASSIEWKTGDIFTIFDSGPIDIVISSLFTHHLSDADVVRFLTWMETHARRGWFINDLHRKRLPYFLMRAISRFAPLHHFVKHDAPASILRAFSTTEWATSLCAAGIERNTVELFECMPARLCLSRVK